MPPRDLPCGELEELARAAEPGPGGSAGYTVYHVIAALREATARPVGRPYLEKVLGIGEASARSMIRRLRALGLLEPAGKSGHRATEKGARLAGLQSLIAEARATGIPGIPWSPVVILATPALEPPRSLVDVYRVRDYIVREGCGEALIGGVRGGILELPGVPGEEIRVELWRIVEEQLLRPLGSRNLLVVAAPERCKARVYAALVKAVIDRCRGSRPAPRQ